MELSVHLGIVLVKRLVGINATDKVHSLRLPTITYLKIRYIKKNSLCIYRPICTLIGNKKIYQLFDIFIVKGRRTQADNLNLSVHF